MTSPANLGASLVSELEAGACVDVRDPPAVAEAIGELQDASAQGRLRVPPSVREQALRRFSRRDRAAELAVVLRRAALRAQTP